MSELVEKTARAIRVAALRAMQPDITEDEIEGALRNRDVDYTFEARAAIAAVAEWLDEHHQLDKDGSVHCALTWQYTAKESK